MTAPDGPSITVTIHLVQSSTVTFGADQLWPLTGAYARFGNDLPSLAEEVTRRLHADGFIGHTVGAETITVIPLATIKRLDFTVATGTSA